MLGGSDFIILAIIYFVSTALHLTCSYSYSMKQGNNWQIAAMYDICLARRISEG